MHTFKLGIPLGGLPSLLHVIARLTQIRPSKSILRRVTWRLGLPSVYKRTSCAEHRQGFSSASGAWSSTSRLHICQPLVCQHHFHYVIAELVERRPARAGNEIGDG
ncbi:hypothetical protein KCP73_08855 [Salmonella enterica subsp. enterica]|nr:hypothetical protein KCP73_08855 [Salmonella enterica subsp. enterica]